MLRVARSVEATKLVDRLLIATDDERIEELGRASGIEVWRSARAFQCGTDRVAAAIRRLGAGDDLILNVQGDEPLVTAAALQAALDALVEHDLGTAAVASDDPLLLADPDVVKVQLDGQGRALDFRRRLGDESSLTGHSLVHLGVYSFSPASLQTFSELVPSPRERREGLEQLRALEAGMTIGVRIAAAPVASVNRPEDLQRIEAMLKLSSAPQAPVPAVGEGRRRDASMER